MTSILGASQAGGDQTDPRLATLFSELKGAAGLDQAHSIDAEIWDIWMRSNNNRVDRLMVSGVVRLNSPHYDQALDAFTQIVSLAPNFAEGWNKRATTLYLVGRFADSIKDIETVLTLEPPHFGALSGALLYATEQAQRGVECV